MTFNTFEELYNCAAVKNVRLFEAVQEKEAAALGLKIDEFREKIFKTLSVMKNSIKAGLNSNELSRSGLSGENCSKIQKYFSKENKIFSPLQQKVLTYALSVAEENARMGKIAACPTAGSSGIVPAVIFGLRDEFNFDNEKIINALIISGITGEIISKTTALAGACGGCQAECGAACAMAAAGACEILGGSNEQILNAVALALKNILGLTCDPVAGLVEVPCVKRNGFFALHSLVASEMALAGINSVLPVDETVAALAQTGALMSSKLKESSEGGLAVTKTAIKISKDLNEKWEKAF